jgi:hypothetical protein
MRFGHLPMVLAAFFLVLSGCQGAVQPPTGTDSASPTPGWEGAADNPWKQAELTVAIETEGDRDYRPLVRAALDYWEEHSERYAGYPLSYRLDPDADDPDLVVAFVPDVTDCGNEKHAAGCAPVLTSSNQIDRPERVRIRTGLSDASTVSVLKHEFGHTLGLVHGDAPTDVMQARSNLTTTPQPDAAEREVPWANDTLRVFVDYDGVPSRDRDVAREQVREALDYYDRGADGTVSERVSFVPTSNRTAADVVVNFDPDACGPGNVSCGKLFWIDPDGDGAPETYTRLEVTVDGDDLDAEAYGWHVARWLGSGFAFEREEDFPPALRQSASYRERRSDWWA